MNLSEAEKRMIYQVEGTSQGAALNEIYMTWRYAPDKAMKDTAEGLLKKLRPLSDKEGFRMMTDTEKKLLQAQHRLEEAQARDRVKERKAGTRRLIQEGAVLEKVLPEVRTIELSELEGYLSQKLGNQT